MVMREVAFIENLVTRVQHPHLVSAGCERLGALFVPKLLTTPRPQISSTDLLGSNLTSSILAAYRRRSDENKCLDSFPLSERTIPSLHRIEK